MVLSLNSTSLLSSSIFLRAFVSCFTRPAIVLISSVHWRRYCHPLSIMRSWWCRALRVRNLFFSSLPLIYCLQFVLDVWQERFKSRKTRVLLEAPNSSTPTDCIQTPMNVTVRHRPDRKRRTLPSCACLKVAVLVWVRSSWPLSSTTQRERPKRCWSFCFRRYTIIHDNTRYTYLGIAGGLVMSALKALPETQIWIWGNCRCRDGSGASMFSMGSSTTSQISKDKIRQKFPEFVFENFDLSCSGSLFARLLRMWQFIHE